MKRFFLILGLFFFVAPTIHAQDNVAEIAHAFMKSVKENDLQYIKGRYLTIDAAYAILPKESTGMSAKEKNEKYLLPLQKRFEDNFKKIQDQIKAGNINTKKIDLVSYKMEPMKASNKIKPQAMSLFFNYNKKEHLIPISVVEIDEHWYILEILYTSNLFE